MCQFSVTLVLEPLRRFIVCPPFLLPFLEAEPSLALILPFEFDPFRPLEALVCLPLVALSFPLDWLLLPFEAEPFLPFDAEPLLPLESEVTFSLEADPFLPFDADPFLPFEAEPFLPFEAEPFLPLEAEVSFPLDLGLPTCDLPASEAETSFPLEPEALLPLLVSFLLSACISLPAPEVLPLEVDPFPLDWPLFFEADVLPFEPDFPRPFDLSLELTSGTMVPLDPSSLIFLESFLPFEDERPLPFEEERPLDLPPLDPIFPFEVDLDLLDFSLDLMSVLFEETSFSCTPLSPIFIFLPFSVLVDVLEFFSLSIFSF